MKLPNHTSSPTMLPGEPVRWYRRYLAFLERGPSRKIVDVWREEAPEGRRKKQIPGNWGLFTRRYLWVERAAAYDLALARQTMDNNQQQINVLIHQDLQQISDMRVLMCRAIQNASLGEAKYLSPSNLVKMTRCLARLHNMTYSILDRVPVKEKASSDASKYVINIPRAVLPKEMRSR